jgi:phenylacetate-CoA ligase
VLGGTILVTNYLRTLYYLNALRESAFWEEERLLKFQEKKLRTVVSYAYNFVPFYHRKYKSAGIRPEDIKKREDLSKLPTLRKDEIRNNPNEMISREYNVEKLRRLSTSGSTGTPTHIYVSQAESEFRKAKHLRANISCGQKPFDLWATITAPHHFSEATRLQRVLAFYAPRPISVFQSVDSQLSTLQKWRPDILDGYSSSLAILAKEARDAGVKGIKPRFVIGGAELIDSVSRRLVEESFSAPFYDQYSSVELERMSWQCREKQGYHIDADAMILQFLDKSGEKVSVGERGEIVCTSLFNVAMPLIRYAIGDVGVQSDESCACGRTLPLMKLVEGRKDSLLLFPDGRVMTPRTFTIAMNEFKLYRYIDQFRLTQKKLDLLEVEIKVTDDCSQANLVQDELFSYLRATLDTGANVTWRVNVVEDIPLDRTGKLMAVVSQLDKRAENPQ